MVAHKGTFEEVAGWPQYAAFKPIVAWDTGSTTTLAGTSLNASCSWSSQAVVARLGRCHHANFGSLTPVAVKRHIARHWSELADVAVEKFARLWLAT